MPPQKRVTKSVNFEKVLSKAAGILNWDMDLFRKSAIISKSLKSDRDLLIYIAWQLRVATSQQIGEKFVLTYQLFGNSPGNSDRGKSKYRWSVGK